MRPALPDGLRTERVLAIARHLDSATAPGVVAALAEGGISTIEITVEEPLGFGAIESVAGGRATVGAGTVVSIASAVQAVAAGAEFLVSPHREPDLVSWAIANDIPLIPGAWTPTEIASAWRLDPPAVKLFPASVGGPGYVKSLLGPYPDLILVPTGGIDGENAAAFLSAGATAVGVGAWLTEHADLSKVTDRAELLRRQVV